MKLIEWEVSEDSYQEQINIPKEIRDLAEDEGISTEVKENARLAITGTHQLYLPVETQKMLEGSGRIRIRLL